MKRQKICVYPPQYHFDVNDFTRLDKLRDVVVKLETWMKETGMTEDELHIDFEIKHTYGYDHVDVDVHGYRDETDKEIQIREKKEVEVQNQQREHELKMFESLKRKYGA